MPCDEPVEPVDERRCVQRPQERAERPGETQLGEQKHAAAAVAWDGRLVWEDEPPARAAQVLGHRREQLGCLVLLEQNERQPFVPIEPGNDPRCPTAEPSAAVVEHYRPSSVVDHVPECRTAARA